MEGIRYLDFIFHSHKLSMDGQFEHCTLFVRHFCVSAKKVLVTQIVGLGVYSYLTTIIGGLILKYTKLVRKIKKIGLLDETLNFVDDFDKL